MIGIGTALLVSVLAFLAFRTDKPADKSLGTSLEAPREEVGESYRVRVIPGDIAVYTAVILTSKERVVLRDAEPISTDGDIEVLEARASTISQRGFNTYPGLACATQWPPTNYHYTLPVAGFIADPDDPPRDAFAISFWARATDPVTRIKGIRVSYTDPSGELKYQAFEGAAFELNVGPREKGDDLLPCRPYFDDGSTF